MSSRLRATSALAGLCFASSSSIYGAVPELPKHESMRPAADLAVRGLEASRRKLLPQLLRGVRARDGRSTVLQRIGPRQDPDSEYAAVIPKFIRAFAQGEFACDLRRRRAVPPTLHIRGQRRQRENMAAIDAPGVGGRVYNVACGHGSTLNEIARRLPRRGRPEVDVCTGPTGAGDVRHSMADIGAARSDLGLRADRPRSSEGIRPVPYVNYTATGSSDFSGGCGTRAARRGAEGAERHRVARPAMRRASRSGTLHGGAGLHRLAPDGGDTRRCAMSARVVILDDLSDRLLRNIQHLVDSDRVSFFRVPVTMPRSSIELDARYHQCIHLASAVGVQMIVNEPLDTLMKSVRGSNVDQCMPQCATAVRVLFSSTSEVSGKAVAQGASTSRTNLIFGSPSIRPLDLRDREEASGSLDSWI